MSKETSYKIIVKMLRGNGRVEREEYYRCDHARRAALCYARYPNVAQVSIERIVEETKIVERKIIRTITAHA